MTYGLGPNLKEEKHGFVSPIHFLNKNQLFE
jgi:hypothetical protein